MNNYYLHLVILQNCPYGYKALDLLKKHPKIKKTITIVNDSNQENYKTNKIKTFPQIYLKKHNRNGSLLIGGYTELTELFDLFCKKKYSNDTITQFIDNNDRWSNTSLLKFIKLINSV